MPQPRFNGFDVASTFWAVAQNPETADSELTAGTVHDFRQEFTLEYAIGSHACSLHSSEHACDQRHSSRVSTFLPVHTLNCVQTLEACWRLLVGSWAYSTHRICRTRLGCVRWRFVALKREGLLLHLCCIVAVRINMPALLCFAFTPLPASLQMLSQLFERLDLSVLQRLAMCNALSYHSTISVEWLHIRHCNGLG
jgi:hypothetical protein